MIAVKTEQLTCQYASETVLADISFQVRKGEFFIIIGPNGSGKTTLLKTLNSIIRPRHGKIEISGHALETYSRKALARVIAFVPQEVPSDFPFRVREVVLMGRSPHMGMLGLEDEKDQAIAGAAMKFTHVAHLSQRKMSQLSGGERQRVFIARAICQNPQIILLDEPTASLDPGHQIRIMDLMEELKRERKITIIMVSHDINLAAMYGDRLLLLKKGRIVNVGGPEQVLSSESLEAAYDCRLLVGNSPLGDFPQITPVPRRFSQKMF